jgi:AraC family transcriptional regulator
LRRACSGRTLRAREASGVRLSEDVYPAGTRLAGHRHERPFFSLTLTGGYVERHVGRHVEYGDGSIAFHPAGEEHSVAFGTADVRCLNVEVREEWLRATGRSPVFVRAVGGPLAWLGHRIHDELRSWSDTSPVSVEGLVLEMLGVLGVAPAPHADRLPPPWLGQAEELLRQEYTSPLTVAGVATRVGVHPVHLSRTWRRFRRCSIGDALRRLRIDDARRRMDAGEAHLAQLALEVGFADQAHFTRAFRRVSGTTPGAYRRRSRRLPA